MKQEDFDRALRIDVPSYLSKIGVNFTEENTTSYREMDNRSVVWHPPGSNPYGMWLYYDFSNNRGSSGSILTYLTEYHNYTKSAALQAIASFAGVQNDQETTVTPRPSQGRTQTTNSGFVPVEKKKFSLPERSTGDKKDARVIAYLLAREIDKEVIFTCIHKGLVFQSQAHGNAVFVGMDPNGIPRHAALRGTASVVDNPFKGEVPSGDSRYTFCVPARPRSSHPSSHKETLYVTESPIDALSIATIMNIKQGAVWRDGKHYLGLCGVQKTSSAVQYLIDHPSITHVVLALDNDRAGKESTTILQGLLKGKSVSVLRYDDGVKDPNEFLMKHKNKLIQDQQQGKERKNYGRENTNTSHQSGQEPRRNVRRREH